MAKFRCPSCRTKNPVVSDLSTIVHIPASDQCKKCGADLREPALDQLDQLPFMGDKSAEEILELGEREHYGRLAGLELRAQLLDRLGRSPDEAEHDRRQALEEMNAKIAGDADIATLRTDLVWRAAMHERVGGQTEGARDTLLVADLHAAEGGDEGASAAVVASPLVAALGGSGSESGPELGEIVSVGFFGGDSDAYAAGQAHYALKAAKELREKLIAEGRAVGVGVCEKCGGVVELTAEGRCPRHKHRKVELQRFVVPEDAEAARAELTGQAAGEGVSAPDPADWYPDPAKRHEYRYWDGARWTEHVSDAGEQSVDPTGAEAATSA